MTWPRPFQGQFVVRRLGLAMINMYTEFEVSRLSRSRDILAGTKNLKWVTWHDHALFRDVLSSVRCDLLCSTHTLGLKCLRLPATKKWRATPNVKILVLSNPLGDLEVTHRVHLWLDGKGVVDFLLVLIKFFSLALTSPALYREICQNRRFLTGWVTLSANFR